MKEIEKRLNQKKGQLWMINGFIDTLVRRKEELWKQIVTLEDLLKEKEE